MPKPLSILSFATAIALGSAVWAQEADTATDTTQEAAPEAGEAQTEGTEGTGAFATGTEVAPQEPAVYVKEQFGDWNLRCFRNPEGEDPCQLYQLLREAQGNPVAEFSIFRLEGQPPAIAGATVIVPLVTLLTEELKISVDGGAAKSYPYRVCTEAGCVAQLGLTQADVNAFKRGAQATVTLVPAQAPDQTINIPVSLSGFTKGYEAVASFTE